MSEAHPDADLVRVTRTTTTYEPAVKTGPVVAKRRNSAVIWVLAVTAAVLIAVIATGAVYFGNQQNVTSVNPGQARAEDLNQQAAAAQQSADQSAAQTRSLAATAARDKAAARHAAAGANEAR
jgi:uncharacterized protein HemX